MTDRHTKTLMLHIGHEKTGSSYLQEMLAANTTELARQGVVYPLKTADFRGPMPLSVSGNAQGFFRSGADMSPWLDAPEVRAADCLLYSSEYLCPELGRNPGFEHNLEAFRAYGFEDIRFLLIIRDPIEFAVSSHQQIVKMRNCTQTIDAFLEQMDFWTDLLRVVELLKAAPDIQLEIFNYSRYRSRIYDRIFDWIGVDQSALQKPEGVVNESMSFAELQFQTMLNTLFKGQLSMFRSGAPLARLGAGDRAKGVPGEAVQKRFLARIAPQLDALNRHLRPEEAYHMEPTRGDFVFGERQLSEDEVRQIVQVMGEEILKLRKLRRTRGLGADPGRA